MSWAPDSRTDGRELNFVAVGQSLMKRDIRAWLDSPTKQLVEVIRAADVAFTNFEATIWGAHGCWPMKLDSFGGVQADVLDAIKEMGFTMLSLANNHGFDLGPGGVLATIDEVRRRGFIHAGTGHDHYHAGLAGYGECSLGPVAVVAMDGCGQPDVFYAMDGDRGVPSRPGLNRQRFTNREPDLEDAERNWRQLREAKRLARFVVCYVHHHMPFDLGRTPAYAREFSRRCIDAGADVVQWDGTPVLQGIEVYHDRPIVYGLSNFVFHTMKPQFWKNRLSDRPWRSLLVRCRFAESGALAGFDLLPVSTGGDIALAEGGPPTYLDAPQPAQGELAHDILTEAARLSEALGTHIEISDTIGLWTRPPEANATQFAQPV